MDGIKTPSMVWSGDLPQELMAFKQYVTLIFKGPLSKLKSEERMTYDVRRTSSYGSVKKG